MSRNSDESRVLVFAELNKEQTINLKRRGIEMVSALGSGGFGTVYEIVYWERQMALKIQQIGKETKHIFREIMAIRQLSHEHIVECYDLYKINDRILTVMELAPGGDLYYLINYKQCLEERVAARFYLQMTSALEYCHARGIAHRDIKPENIFLDRYRTVCKVGDFGLATFSYEFYTGKEIRRATLTGTMIYLGPEALEAAYLNGVVFDERKMDVWAVGVTLFNMLNGNSPPFRVAGRDILKRHPEYVPLILDQMKNHHKSVEWSNKMVSREMKRFQALHWTYDPNQRPWFPFLRRQRCLNIAYSFTPELLPGNLRRRPRF